jgi:hypothetical protein
MPKHRSRTTLSGFFQDVLLQASFDLVSQGIPINDLVLMLFNQDLFLG